MNTFEGLICPATNEPCKYAGYCGALKEERENPVVVDGESIPLLAEDLPEPLQSVLAENWCSTARINALGAIAATHADPEITEEAMFLHGRVQENRELFPS